MSDKLITLRLPEDLYESLRAAAEAGGRSLEHLAVESLNLLFPSAGQELLDTSDEALSALSAYTDEQLWAVVHLRLPTAAATHFHELNLKGSSGALSPNDATQQERLAALVAAQMLYRSEALVLLKQRGYAVTHFFEPSTG